MTNAARTDLRCWNPERGTSSLFGTHAYQAKSPISGAVSG